MQKILITGGSGGIGYALARVAAAHGHDIVLAARTVEQLKRAQAELRKDYEVHVGIVQTDLSQPGSAKKLYDTLKKDNVEILVNNAGVGLVGDFFKEDVADHARMIQLNIQSLMELTHYFGNDFIKKKKGRILNVASVAAFVPGPKQPVYYASKAFVRSFSRALTYTMAPHGVSVTVLNPGATKTNFFVQAKAGSMDRGVSADAVAEAAYAAMMSGKAEITYGFTNRILTNVLVKVVPYRWHALLVDKGAKV